MNPQLAKLMCSCSRNAMNMYQGGNMWGWWDCYLTAARDILGLRLPAHEKYASWEQAAIHGGFRIMHEEFCMVSDFPAVLKKDEDNRPHCENGPSHLWRDGWALWFWHGVSVPRLVIEHPEQITVKMIRKEENAEVRRIMMERMGWEKFCSEAKMKVIHRDTLRSKFPVIPVSDNIEKGKRMVVTYRAGEETAELLESEEFRDFEDRPLKFVRLTDPSTGRQYLLRVWHDCKRAYEAVGRTFGLNEKQYLKGSYARQGDVLLWKLSGEMDQQTHS